MTADDWDAMKLEGDLFPEETEEARARRIMRESLPHTVQRVVNLTDSDNDRVALDASKYLIDRVLGKAGDDPSHASDGTLAGLVAELEKDLKRSGT